MPIMSELLHVLDASIDKALSVPVMAGLVYERIYALLGLGGWNVEKNTMSHSLCEGPNICDVYNIKWCV